MNQLPPLVMMGASHTAITNRETSVWLKVISVDLIRSILSLLAGCFRGLWKSMLLITGPAEILRMAGQLKVISASLPSQHHDGASRKPVFVGIHCTRVEKCTTGPPWPSQRTSNCKAHPAEQGGENLVPKQERFCGNSSDKNSGGAYPRDSADSVL